MKRILFVVITFTCLLQLSAQTKQGTISYERKINLWKRITDPERRASIPQFRITKHTLLFCDTVSVFKTIQEEDAINPFDGGGEGGGFGGGGRGGRGGGGGGGFGGGRMSRMLGSSDGDLYKNFSQGITIQSTEQSGKNFLITDTLRKQPWKITDETKIILGYTCHKATLKQKGGFGGGFGGGGSWGGGRRRDREQGGGDAPQTPDTTHRTPREVEVVAWFADNIYAPVGPSNYGQLPGAILEVDIDNGSAVITATEVKNAVSPKDLKEPKKGKKVTREEYMKLLEDLKKNYGSVVPDAGTQQ